MPDSTRLGRGDPSCWVTGIITARDTGRPLAGVDVHAEPLPEEGGFQWWAMSDGRGRYSLPIEIPGIRTVHYDGYGVTLQRDVSLVRGEIRDHDLDFPSLTSDPPYDWLEGEFVGEFRLGFEMKWFVPDSEQVLDSSGKTRVVLYAWVPELEESFSCGRHRVRWVGTIAGPGRFGHLRGSAYLMTVEKVVSQDRLPRIAPRPAGSM